MIGLPPLNSLRAFVAAGHRLNFRVAAEDMGVTPGAVAQQVRQLEDHLGIRLFDRLPKGLALTPAGRSYHNRIAAAFDDLLEATTQLKPEPDKVLISVTPTFASKWLIPNLPDFAEAHPNIDLRILATELVSSFHSDGIQLAVRQGTPPFGAALSATLLFKRDIIAVVAPSLIEGSRGRDTMELLSKLPKIHDTHSLWPQLLTKTGVSDTSKRNLHLNQTALAIDAAIAGQGVALVSSFLVCREIEQGNLVTIGSLPAIEGPDFYLLVTRKTQQYKSVNHVISWLKSRSTIST